MNFQIALNYIRDYNAEDQLVFQAFIQLLNPKKLESYNPYIGNFLERTRSDAKMVNAINRSTDVTIMTPMFFMKLFFSYPSS